MTLSFVNHYGCVLWWWWCLLYIQSLVQGWHPSTTRLEYATVARRRNTSRHHPSTSLILATNGHDKDADNDDDDNDEEDHQEQQEDSASSPAALSKEKRHQRELDHRQAEYVLLQELAHGDEGIAKLKKHWFANSQPLWEADMAIGKGPEYWKEAEDVFLELLREDPTFLEPKARLSKLYCLQGKFDEAKELSLIVLDSKPWHFVAMETMVAIATAQGDTLSAELWKARRLPNPSKVEQRQQWVARALEDAGTMLQRFEQEDCDSEGTSSEEGTG